MISDMAATVKWSTVCGTHTAEYYLLWRDKSCVNVRACGGVFLLLLLLLLQVQENVRVNGTCVLKLLVLKQLQYNNNCYHSMVRCCYWLATTTVTT
jgi:hypothetical protein